MLRRPIVCLTPKVKLGSKLFLNPYVFTTPKKLAAMGAVTVIPIRGWRMVRPIVPGTPEVGTDGPMLTVYQVQGTWEILHKPQDHLRQRVHQ